MQQMSYRNTASLKTGLKGWNDYDQPLIDHNENIIDAEVAEELLSPAVNPEQLSPK